MFLSCVGEKISVEERESQNSFKVLVVRESFSSTVGAILMTENVEKDRSLLVRWLDECGLSSTGSVRVTLVTDSEQHVSTFVSRSSGKYHFLVRKASPQSHKQNGGVENAIRSLKQSLKTTVIQYQLNHLRPEVKTSLHSFIITLQSFSQISLTTFMDWLLCLRDLQGKLSYLEYCLLVNSRCLGAGFWLRFLNRNRSKC